MNLGEILTIISRKYPNNVSEAEPARVVQYINVVQAELFRNFCRTITTYEKNIMPGISYYAIDFSPSKITEVLVNGVLYPYKNMEDNGSERFSYFLDGRIGIYPTPKDPGTLVVFHELEPTKLDSTKLQEVPDLDPDYHMLLVYGACVHLAEEAREFDVASGFTNKYNGLLTDYKNATDEPEYHVIQNVWGGLT